MYQEYPFARDIQKEGYSLYELAVESLVYELEIYNYIKYQ